MLTRFVIYNITETISTFIISLFFSTLGIKYLYSYNIRETGVSLVSAIRTLPCRVSLQYRKVTITLISIFTAKTKYKTLTTGTTVKELISNPEIGAKKIAINPPIFTQVYIPNKSLGSASSINKQYHAVWLICSKLLNKTAIKKSQKLPDMLHIRQATVQPKKSPIMVVNFRPILSVMMPPKKEKNTWTNMEIDKISPICTSVIPCEYIYSVAKGAIRLYGIPHSGSINIRVLGFPLLCFNNSISGCFPKDFVLCAVFTGFSILCLFHFMIYLPINMRFIIQSNPFIAKHLTLIIQPDTILPELLTTLWQGYFPYIIQKVYHERKKNSATFYGEY